MNKKKIVVYVDDDEDDLEIFASLFPSIATGPILKTFRIPEEALQYLRHAEELDEFNCYILVDVNLLITSGFDFLNTLRADEKLKDHYVALITTSHNPREKQKANELGVDIIVKPSSVDELSVIVNSIVDHCNNMQNNAVK